MFAQLITIRGICVFICRCLLNFRSVLDYFSDDDDDDLLDTSSNGPNEGLAGSAGHHSLLNSNSSGYYDSVAAVAAAGNSFFHMFSCFGKKRKENLFLHNIFFSLLFCLVI